MSIEEDYVEEPWEEEASLRKELERQNEANRESAKRQEAMLMSLLKNQEVLQKRLEAKNQEEDSRRI